MSLLNLSCLSLIARQATDPAAAAGKLREGSPEQLLKYEASTDDIRGKDAGGGRLSPPIPPTKSKMQEAVGSPRLFQN